MNKHLSIAMLFLGASLALGFVYGMGKVSTAIQKFKQENMVKVKGCSEKNIRSDHGTWSCEISAADKDLSLAYQKLKSHNGAVSKFISESGFTGNEIRIYPVDYSVIYKVNEKGNITTELDHYSVKQRFEIDSKEVNKIENISKAASDLMESGIEIKSYPPSYTFSEIEKIKLELIAAATKNGYERAATLALNSNGKVGELTSAQQGVFQIVPVNSVFISDYGEYDTSTIDKTVKAVVTLEFLIDK